MALTRDHARMEKRRVQAAAMFEKGISAPEVGRRLGVSRQVAYRWKSAWEKGGKAGLASKGEGRKSKLTAEQTDVAVKALVAGPVSRGYKTNLWSASACGGSSMGDLTGVEYHPGHVWRLLGDNGFSCQRPERRA
ncbi:MAG: helix-turn-helix domain-containing protein [Verrucomicrobiota bacterium]